MSECNIHMHEPRRNSKVIRIVGNFILTAILMMIIIKIPVGYAIENDSSNLLIESAKPVTKDEVTIGSANNPIKSLEKENFYQKVNKSPSVEEATVLGDFNKSEIGVGYFKDISITLIGENLTDDHFLTSEGLHWSDKTSVEIMHGFEMGDYDFSAFPQEAPIRSIKAYSINNGDSGRITNVGRTRSGIDLDLIWTVITSDKEEWASNSGYNDNRIKGLGFVGEQFFPGSKGNSIAVLYNNASILGLHYKIVKHGTLEEQPVVISFISTDIDSAQGVDTDLANIVEVIPEESNLLKKDGIIYDSTKGVVNLNGSVNLPRGGYIGVGFLSNFNYVFYSPAPERSNDSYYYPIAVRYDIFGSSLQAKILPKINQHVTVQYVDLSGRDIKPKEYYRGFIDETYILKSLVIPKYKLIDSFKDESDVHRPIVKFIYSPEYEVKFKFVDENGKSLFDDKKFIFLDGEEINYKPIEINGYESPSDYKGTIVRDTEHVFVYKKVRTTTNYTRSALLPRSERIQNYYRNTTRNSNKGNNKTDIISPRSKSKTRDPFLINTNMSKDEKKQFLDYINEVTRQAKKRYGNDKNKINHAIANAIAYPIYSNDELQTKVNDFGVEPNVKNRDDIYILINKFYGDEKYKIDFPHLATSLASAESSGKLIEITKWIAGLGISNLWGNSPKNNFFQQNSLTGDILSNMDARDYRSDIDAIIFHYHPDYKDLTLDEAIINYYHMENLHLERERLYKEVLQLQTGKGVTEKEQEFLNIFSAIVSIGGLGLILFTLLKKFKGELEKFIESPSKYMNTIWSGIKDGIKLFIKDPLQFIGINILGSISNHIADSLLLGGIIINILHKKLYYNFIAPIVNLINKNIIKPINKNIIKPIFKHTLKPILLFMERKILKPIVTKVIKPLVKSVNKKIIQPIINKVVKPTVKFVSNKVVKPIMKNILKPIAKHVYRKVVKPIHSNLVQPIYKKLIKPIVQPMFNKVVKPTIKYVHHNIVKPVTKFVKKKVVKPVVKFNVRLWR